MEAPRERKTAHNVLVHYLGECPFCGTSAFGECPEPQGNDAPTVMF